MPRSHPRRRRRTARLLSVLSATALLLVTALAVAPSSQAEICSKLGLEAKCRLVLGEPGGDGGKGGGKKRPLCHRGAPAYNPIGCFSSVGPWSNERQCYLGENNDELDYSRPEWEGHTTGRLYDCVNSEGLTIGTYWYENPPQIEGWNARSTAQTVLGLRFIAFPLGLAPSARRYAEGSAGVVGMPVWMWAAGQYLYTYADPPVTVREPGTPYYVTAGTTHTTWDMGDGTTVRCKKGTEYFPSFKLRDSPTCGHRYKEPGYYRVTIRTYWKIEWVDANGYDEEELEFERSAVIRVLESQTVNAA